jgi:hypothetical protein
MAAPPRKPLDKSIRTVRNAVNVCADRYLAEFLRGLRAGRPVETALDSVPRPDGDTLREALQAGWEASWRTTSLELQALVRRNPRRWQRYDRRVEQHAQELPAGGPRLRLPSPLKLPGDYRTWAETHTPAEGGTADAAQSRTTAEWLAEHEATVSKFIPTEYRDAYIERRLPPLVGVADEDLKRACRDTAAAVAERGFGVRESMAALHDTFPDFSSWRIETIARTEGAVLYEHGRAARYLADPLVIGVRIDGVADSRQTDICEEIDGRCYKFGSGAVLLPPYHFACRTSTSPVLFDEESSVTWSTEPIRAMAGFGTPDYGEDLPPNEGQGQLPFLDATQAPQRTSSARRSAKPAEVPAPAVADKSISATKAPSTAAKPVTPAAKPARVEVPRLKSTDEYDAWLAEHHPEVRIVPGSSKADMAALRPTLKAIIEEAGEFGDMYSADSPLYVGIDRGESMQARAAGQMLRQADIGGGVRRDIMVLNGRYYESRDKLLRAVETSHREGFSATKGIASTPRHEYGHALRDRIAERHPEELARWHAQVDPSRVSQYATENEEETFAEAYALLRDHDTRRALGMKTDPLPDAVASLRGLLGRLGYNAPA